VFSIGFCLLLLLSTNVTIPTNSNQTGFFETSVLLHECESSYAFMHQPATEESKEAFDMNNISNILFQ